MDSRLKLLDFNTLALSLSDLLMPRVCLCCGRALLPDEEHLCYVCMADLPLTFFEGMVHNPMADKLNALVEGASSYCRAVALFYYKEHSYGRITQALKYGRNFAAGRFFARMMAERLAGSEFWRDIDVVCPVPLHFSRQFKRGYNQAAVIAEVIADRIGARFEPRLLRRVRHTGTQTQLSGEERMKNVRGAFAIREGVLTDSIGQGKVLKIMIIDDVFTTGSSLASCHNAIKQRYGSAVEICIATLAYTDGK